VGTVGRGGGGVVDEEEEENTEKKLFLFLTGGTGAGVGTAVEAVVAVIEGMAGTDFEERVSSPLTLSESLTESSSNSTSQSRTSSSTLNEVKSDM